MWCHGAADTAPAPHMSMSSGSCCKLPVDMSSPRSLSPSAEAAVRGVLLAACLLALTPRRRAVFLAMPDVRGMGGGDGMNGLAATMSGDANRLLVPVVGRPHGSHALASGFKWPGGAQEGGNGQQASARMYRRRYHDLKRVSGQAA